MKLLENLLNKINNSNKNIVYPVDFHIHTSWTDGKNTVKEMYNSSLKKGIKAILFSILICHFILIIRNEINIFFSFILIRTMPKLLKAIY